MKYVLVFVVSAFAQICYCNGVLERSFIAEHTADKDLEHSRLSQRSQFKSGGSDLGDLENSQKPAGPLFGAHFLHGSTNGRMVQSHSNWQQQQKLDIKHHQCQQHQQKQRPQAVKTIIANNRQMPKNNQQTGPAEQHTNHQHQPHYKLNRQYNKNNNNNTNYHIDRSNGNNKRNDNKHREVQGHHDQFGTMHESNQNNSNIKNNYHNNFTMSKSNNINASNVAHHIGTPDSIPTLAIRNTTTATTTTKASATTATMKTTASTPSQQKVLPLKSISGIQRALPSTSTLVQQPIPQNTKLNINTVSHFIANHVPPTTRSPRLATGDMSTLHFRRSVSNNPFLQNQPLRNQNVETSSVEKFFKQTSFMQNPFFQNHSLPNPSNQIPLVPNNESTQNPWLLNLTPKPTNPGYAMQNPYTPVAASNPFIPNFPVQTPSEPLPDRTPDPFMPFIPNFSFNPTTSIPNKMSSESVPAGSTSAQIDTQNLIKSQADENISSTPSTSSTSTTQSIVTSSSAMRAPTISPALNELIKKGAIIFPDLLYPTATTSSAQQLIDIRRR